MKKLAILAAALLAATAIAQDKKAPAPAPAPAAKPAPGGAAAEVTTVTATVEAIDQKTREVTLKGTDGKLVTFIAGPEVRNLAQVQKGDIVTMAYIEAVAMKLSKTDNKTRSRVVTPFEKRAEVGQMPAGVAGVQVKVVASVEAVDTKASKVTLRGVEHTVSLKVRDPAVLAQVKVGDMVEAEFVEAVAVKVERAPAKPAAPAAPAKK